MLNQSKIDTLSEENKKLEKTLEIKNQQIQSLSLKLRDITQKYHALELSMYKDENEVSDVPEHVAREQIAKIQLALLKANAKNVELEQQLRKMINNKKSRLDEWQSREAKLKNDKSNEPELSQEAKRSLQRWADDT